MADNRIRENELHVINTEAGEFMVCAAYDTIHSFPWLNMWIAKIQVDGEGIANLYLLEEEAVDRLQELGLPVAEREFIYEREYDGYLEAMGASLDEVYEEMEWDDGEE